MAAQNALRQIAVVLHEIGPVPETSDPELAVLEADALVLGNVRETFARFIRNGETAILVRAETDEDANFAIDIMRLYAPLTIEVLRRHPAGNPLATSPRNTTIGVDGSGRR